jgi:hypothetical protein
VYHRHLCAYIPVLVPYLHGSAKLSAHCSSQLACIHAMLQMLVETGPSKYMLRVSEPCFTWEVQEGALQQLLAVCCIHPTGAHVGGPHQCNVQGWDGVLQFQVVLPQQQELGISAAVQGQVVTF